MREHILEIPVTNWICQLCGKRDATREAQAHTRMHACPAMGGLTAPMYDIRLNHKTEVTEREDYIGSEAVQMANGRPVMNIKTTRDDGEDIVVFAPMSKMEAS